MLSIALLNETQIMNNPVANILIRLSKLKKMNGSPIIILLLFFSFSLFGCSQNKQNKVTEKNQIEWLPAELIQKKSNNLDIRSNPQLVDSPYGKAVHFDGIDDALFLEAMPLQSLKEFTVEMIFFPDTSSPFEQRILHIGDVLADRMLLEIRAVDNNWYFDGFVASGSKNLALIDESLTHPLGQWYHVAFVVGMESLTTYVNGQQELSESFSFKPIENGRTSIGVRQNEYSWFMGLIYKIRITPKELKPDDFMTY